MIGNILRGIFYAVAIVLMFPFLLLFRCEEREPSIDDGFSLGYDDDDPGKDVDE